MNASSTANPTDTNKKSPGPLTKRGAATYQRVIEAGMELIAEKGFHAASTNKIAEAAGVTWGTLQHQFGDKARLLEAILEYSFNQQMEQITHAGSLQQSLAQRVDDIIEAIWLNQQTLSSRVMLEILLAVQGDAELSQRFHPTLEKLRDFYNEQWGLMFGDVNIDQQQMEAIKELTFASLRGLAQDVKVRSSDVSIQAAKALLKDTLVRLFSKPLTAIP